MRRVTRKNKLLLFLILSLGFFLSVTKIYITPGVNFWKAQTTHAKDKEKDKTPPVISELRAESITENSAVILWTTDEQADSNLRYGVDPHFNKKIDDPSFVITQISTIIDKIENNQ